MHTFNVSRKHMRTGITFTLQVEAGTPFQAVTRCQGILDGLGLTFTSHISTIRVF